MKVDGVKEPKTETKNSIVEFLNNSLYVAHSDIYIPGDSNDFLQLIKYLGVLPKVVSIAFEAAL